MRIKPSPRSCPDRALGDDRLNPAPRNPAQSPRCRFAATIASRVSLLILCALTTAASAQPWPRLDRTNLLVYHDRLGQQRPVRSKRQWELRRAEILHGMQEVMGALPAPARRVPLDPTVIEETDCGGYLRRFLTYSAEPGSRVPAYLLIPKQALTPGHRAPAILCLHQTHPAGQRVVVGLGNSPNDEYGVELAQRGYVCLAPAYPQLANYNPDLGALGYTSGTMKAIWDNIRGLDLLDSLPFVRHGHFGAIGHSLGGHNAVFTAVFDRRLEAVVSSCGLDMFEDYMGGNIAGWTSSRYMPALRAYALKDLPFDFTELIGALAPRPCLLSAPLGDTNFKWRSVDRIRQAAQPVYDLLGAPQNLQVRHPDCAHLFPRDLREQAYQLFDRTLRP